MELGDSLKKRKVLLVDGDEWVRKSLGCFFKGKLGVFVAVVDQEQALKKLESGGYDIVICDYNLPDADGLAFSKLVGSLYPHILIILTATCVTRQMVDEAAENGICEIIQKPLSADILQGCLIRLSNMHNNRVYHPVEARRG